MQTGNTRLLKLHILAEKVYLPKSKTNQISQPFEICAYPGLVLDLVLKECSVFQPENGGAPIRWSKIHNAKVTKNFRDSTQNLI